MKMKYFVIITAIMLCVLSTACRTQKSTAVASEVPYVVAKGYFVRNDVRRIPNGKITDARLFKEIFGAAAVMGPDGLPTKIDFEKDYVIVVFENASHTKTEIFPSSLSQLSDGTLRLVCRIEKGEEQSFTSLPCLILVVSRQYDAPLSIVR